MTFCTSHLVWVIKISVIPGILLDPAKEVSKVVAPVGVSDKDAVTTGSVGVNRVVAHGGLVHTKD